MTVREALDKCEKMAKCEGITFQDEERLFLDPLADPTHEVSVEFKDKVQFGADDGWQSFLKHVSSKDATYYPLGCNSAFLVNPPPKELDVEKMLPCWPRYFNHHCDPNTETVPVPVPEGFVIPGVPWKRVLNAYQLRAVRDLAAHEEITLNYETLPSYMLRKIEGAECDTKDVTT